MDRFDLVDFPEERLMKELNHYLHVSPGRGTVWYWYREEETNLSTGKLDTQGAYHNVFSFNITQRSEVVTPGVMIYLFYPKFDYMLFIWR